ncbi:MAG TPA: RnfABCDGE type electron transport complex subunit D [Gemmatimonadaceae bacterium]|nr:RnfABCDGE type electron transport complex subunit D [Gemmatimonadaceae bacterium]
MTVSRFFRTPKGLALIVLALLTILAGLGEGLSVVAPGIGGAVLPAMLIDAAILRGIKGKWVFPSGALLTGLIVAMILSPREPWYVAAVTAAVGVISKYLVRVRTANVFNPAALALVATFYAFDTAQSWWGAAPEISPIALVALLASGAFIAYKVNKIPAVIAFLGGYYALAAITAFAGDPRRVAELYRAPDLHATLYFAFFMVTDPPTSPPRHRDQLLFGAIAAAASYAAFELIGAAYFLLAGLLVANAWEGWRRSRLRMRRRIT